MASVKYHRKVIWNLILTKKTNTDLSNKTYKPLQKDQYLWKQRHNTGEDETVKRLMVWMNGLEKGISLVWEKGIHLYEKFGSERKKKG